MSTVVDYWIAPSLRMLKEFPKISLWLSLALKGLSAFVETFKKKDKIWTKKWTMKTGIVNIVNIWTPNRSHYLERAFALDYKDATTRFGHSDVVYELHHYEQIVEWRFL